MGTQAAEDKSLEKKASESPPTKVIVRRLPPHLTSEEFLQQIAPVPEYTYYCYCQPDHTLGSSAFCRAYITFINYEEIYLFREKFDNYVFVDTKGNECPAVVEFAPFQKVPKKSKKIDSKKGTIEEDGDYEKFIQEITAEPVPGLSTESFLEEIEAREREIKANNGLTQSTTPLIEYINKRRQDRRLIIQRNREERRRKDIERKRIREEERKKRVEKERKEKLRQREREKAAREKDKKDDTSDDRGADKEGDSPVKFLKKDGDINKGKASDKEKPVSTDKSKENTKKDKSERQRLGDGRPKDTKPRDSDKAYPKDRPDRPDRDKYRDKDRGGKSRPDTSDVSKDFKPRFSKEERERTKQERQDRDKERDKHKSASSSKGVAEGKGKERVKSSTSRQRPIEKESSRNATGRTCKEHADKKQAVSAAQGDGKTDKESNTPNRCEAQSKPSGSGDQQEGADSQDKKERADRRARYKDRPERAIYVPGRRAAERKEAGRRATPDRKEPYNEPENT